MNYQEYRPAGFQLLPDVVKNLIIINLLAFLATFVLDNTFQYDLTEHYGLYHWSSEKFRPVQFITHLFLHGGLSHIFFNMFALWMFGNVLENHWGGKRFLVYFLVTGLGAGFIHLMVTTYQLHRLERDAAVYAAAPSPDAFRIFTEKHVPEIYLPAFRKELDAWAYDPGNGEFESRTNILIRLLIDKRRDIPVVGASGAVFGLLLAFGLLFPNSLIYLYFALPIKAKYFVFLYGAIELWAGVANNPADNVAHFAHLGGMLFGFILIRSWGKNMS